jgi:hypothetical protein
VTGIVIDTNVLVSAVVFGGKPMLALQLVEALGIELAISNELESELSETLTGKFGWASEQVTDVCDRLFRKRVPHQADPAHGNCPRRRRRSRPRLSNCVGRKPDRNWRQRPSVAWFLQRY